MYNSEDYKNLTKRMQELFASPVMTVVEESGKSKPTVRKFFNQESMRFHNWEAIYEACVKLVGERERKLKALIEKQHEFLPPKDSTNQSS